MHVRQRVHDALDQAASCTSRSARTATRSTRAARSWSTPAVASSGSSAAPLRSAASAATGACGSGSSKRMHVRLASLFVVLAGPSAAPAAHADAPAGVRMLACAPWEEQYGGVGHLRGTHERGARHGADVASHPPVREGRRRRVRARLRGRARRLEEVAPGAGGVPLRAAGPGPAPGRGLPRRRALPLARRRRRADPHGAPAVASLQPGTAACRTCASPPSTSSPARSRGRPSTR